MTLLSNQANKDFEAYSNEAIKPYILLAVTYGVLSLAYFAISMLFTMKNKSARKNLHNRVPSTDS